MKAYVVIDVDVSDRERYQRYMKEGETSVAAHGGRFIVRGGAATTLEAGWAPKRMAIIEFADRAAAQRWWDSPEYGQARATRHGAASFRAVLVDGPA